MENKLKRLKYFIEDGENPILTDLFDNEKLENSVIINADGSDEELFGFYKKNEYVEPSWYQKIISLNTSEKIYLIIDNVLKLSKEDQTKFISLVKDRKFNLVTLPDNVILVINCNKNNIKLLNNELLSYLIII